MYGTSHYDAKTSSGGSASLMIEFLIAVALSQWISLILARYGVSGVPVYILAGMLVGGSNYAHPQSTDALMRVVFLFLFFYAGVNVNVDAVKKYLKESSLLTLLSVTLTTVLVAAALTWLGVDVAASLVAGVALANTATEVAIVMLHESKIDLLELRNLIIAASFMDDLILVILTSLTQSTVFNAPLVQGLTTTIAHFTLLTLPLLLYFITPKFVDNVSWEGYVIFASALAFTVAFVSGLLNIPEYFGMYVAGLALSTLKLRSDPTLSYSTKFYSLLDHFTTIIKFFIMPFFFVIVGTYLSGVAFLSLYTLSLLPAAFAGKLLGFLVYARMTMNLSFDESFLGGLVMNSRGSVETVLAVVALTSRLISRELFHGIVAVTVLSSIITPFMIRLIINVRSIY